MRASLVAGTLLAASPLSARASKAVIRRALQADLQNAMHEHLAYPEIIAMMASADAREGPRAFAEKRAPTWAAR